MTRDIARDLAAPGGVADVDGALEVECRGQLGDVVGVGVHLVAVHRLSGAAVPTAIMGDHPVPVMLEKHHLVVPVVGAQGQP